MHSSGSTELYLLLRAPSFCLCLYKNRIIVSKSFDPIFRCRGHLVDCCKMRAYILAQMIIVVILAFAQQLVNIICCNGTSQSSYVFFDITLFRIVLTQLDNLGLVCFDISEQSKFMNQLDKSWPTTSDWMEVQLRVFVRRKTVFALQMRKDL